MKRIAFVLLTLVLFALGSSAALAKHKPKGHQTPQMSVFASGLNNPRGLAFGPGGKNLFVAEGGLGGTHSSASDPCPQASGAAAPYFGSTNDPVLGGRISKIDRHGTVSTVVSALPSSQTAPALGSLVSGVSSVAFLGHQLYALLAGAGCSHGVPTIPNGVIKVKRNGTWSMIANLSAFQMANPVASPDEDDFEPDGTWFSMTAADGALYPMDSNHGELDRVTRKGSISRVVDISAQVGHNVPTAIVPVPGRHGKGHGHHKGHGKGHKKHGHAVTHKRHGSSPSFVIGNLGVFGPPDGTTPNEHAYLIDGRGHVKVIASGLEQVLGVAFNHGDLYALESSTTPGGPTPGTGAIVRIRHGVPDKTIVSGLVFPTGMTVGRDGAFYVSEQGFGFPAGQGRVIRVTLH
ncbi:MAG TPA: ScyD/ScyE family protein [Gaiellaceae bacterium]|jgi:hypothetical protein